MFDYVFYKTLHKFLGPKVLYIVKNQLVVNYRKNEVHMSVYYAFIIELVMIDIERVTQ